MFSGFTSRISIFSISSFVSFHASLWILSSMKHSVQVHRAGLFGQDFSRMRSVGFSQNFWERP